MNLHKENWPHEMACSPSLGTQLCFSLNVLVVLCDVFLHRLAFKYLSQFSEFLPTLTSAHSLAKLLVAVCRTCKADHIQHSIGQWSHD